MKIAFVTDGLFPDRIGGMQRYSTFLANEMTRQGADVTVFHPPFSKPVDGFPFLFKRIEIPWPDHLQYLWACFEYSRRVARRLREQSFSVAFGQGFSLWAYLRRRTIPCAYHPHGLEMFQTITVGEYLKTVPFRSAVRYHAQHSDAVISLGGRLTDILIHRVEVSPEKVYVIANGVDPDYFCPTEQNHREKQTLLFVGRLCFNKGVSYLIDAFNGLGTDIHLKIVGDGPLRKKLEDHCRNPRVQFLGEVPDKTLKQLYQEVDGLIFTSLYEGMPTVILEAMASGLPVIATDIGAVRALVSLETGLLIPSRSAPAIRQAVLHFFEECSESERQEMGRRAMRKVQEGFTWPSLARKTLDLLSSLCHEKLLQECGSPRD